ncbi:hypothetical protein Acav_1842 [Paracidovorax avenae ATCC 19860]|uniref:Uncharacterized protein n=1 Tax=Paracidovorax avenae (strain ATCC 19860 / DSM 7227 / CCUG 15838 / JCM 20985 / LMG 2117 / NCPPB 1011) TaxID=643561 RepID=F0Q784_PARA1|nr:hypothetical protein [Paracidovorax avenae]ADX45759.1 hypothetical protein Acav_1842 [Paracidovorax avenae ATCC 19860]
MQTSTDTRSNRDNRRGWWMAVATAAIVLAAVIAFNLLGPKNPARPPGDGHKTPASQGAAQSGGPAPDGSVQGAAPQRSDTPTPSGREGVGAPAGAVPAEAAASR